MWLVIGLAVYFGYGKKHSKLRLEANSERNGNFGNKGAAGADVYTNFEDDKNKQDDVRDNASYDGTTVNDAVLSSPGFNRQMQEKETVYDEILGDVEI